MASWRTNGVVLASDDEDDLSDSQESLGIEPARKGFNDVTTNDVREEEDSEDELAKDGYELRVAGGSDETKGISTEPHKETPSRDPPSHSAVRLSSPAVSDDSTDDDELPEITDIKGNNKNASTVLGGRSAKLFGTPPGSRRKFQVPSELTSSESGHGLIGGSGGSASRGRSTQAEMPVFDEMEVDEVSRSYVELSSPLSSPPFPLTDTALEFEESFRTRTGETARSDSVRTMPNGDAEASDKENRPLLPQSTSNQANRRSFRPRNLLQTHPFTLEMEKYRNTLHGAGIMPISLENEDGETRARQDEDSQDQPFETEEDSQTANFIVDSSQPQPVFDDDSDDPLRPLNPVHESTLNALREDMPEELDDPFRPFSPIHRRSPGPSNAKKDSRTHDHHVSDDDEDSDGLPDVGQLLKGHVKASAQAGGTRKRPRTYKTSRTVSTVTSKHNELDIYDFPPSPPITSPTPDSQAAKRILNRVSSLGSRRSSPLTQTRNGDSRAPATATPVASASRRSIEVIPLDSDSENQDQRSLSGSSRASSPEPEDRIRRVAKRIRGVLPASWLRLDQKPQAPKSPPPRIRESESVSPERDVPRRGVAVRTTGRDRSPSASHTVTDPYFLDEESETDDGNPTHPAARLDNEVNDIEPSQFDQSLAGSLFDDAIEEDRIDRMLPSRKRASTSSNSRPSKKRRVSSKLFHGHGSGHARQPKITEQFNRAQNSFSNTQKRRTASHLSARKKPRKKPTTKTQVHKFVPPRLSILDVAENDSQAYKNAPQFIRIASRSARSRRQLGRHSPSRKFIRLDNIEDTADAQTVLRQWREGTIHPNRSLRYPGPLPISARQHTSGSFHSHEDNIAGSKSHTDRKAPRRLVVSKSHQTTLDAVVRSVEDHGTNIVHRAPHNPLPPLRRNGQSLHPRPLAQPAQLETEEREYNRSHPNAGFGTTKKGLDRLYRRSHRGLAVKGDVQLARFLADPDAVGSVTDDDVSYQADLPPPAQQDIIETRPPLPSRRRKRTPQHLDAGAHRYRQPSEPLPVPEVVIPANNNVSTGSSAGKLLNLQPYGTRYTYHFDIFPLQSGIFFHETTFIGSGRLSRVLHNVFAQRNYWDICIACTCVLDEKEIRWAKWDATVSSEIGLCFDWILGQLEGATPPATVSADLLDFILKYVERHLFFTGQDDHEQFIRRICEIVDGFLARACSPDIINGNTIHHAIEILGRVLVLLMQLLRMCQKLSKDFTLGRAVEDLLQSASEKCVALLLSLGIDKIRDFYEECQYLSSREAGVRGSTYYVEAWVITIKVLQAAKIPRSSFWDVVNKRLFNGNLDAIEDARVFEGIWYNMFSLLPLMEFDDEGVVRPGLRHTISFENWALPQKLMKRIFAMYRTKSRQSAGFNDYVRSLFVRCHHLMVEWGWRRCGGLIGTLFDFFASHSLAHLRNEESFNSPHFLEELDIEPSLSVGPEDKCFHIFLKLVATSIKHMRQGNDVKSIRNLVPRLLPNHDRQYPKEEAIHQRDLAALRNHHDLLCTLFWAAPVELRPPVVLLQQLVVPERSHKEACLINLRAWSNLAKFLLASSPVPPEYQQLATWQQSFFTSLVQRYRTAEDDIRQQHAALSEIVQRQHSEQSISDTISKNKEQVIEEMCNHLRILVQQIKNSKDIDVSKTIFKSSRSSVISVLGMFDSRPADYDHLAIEAAFQLVDCYFTKIEQYEKSLSVPDFEEREASILSGSGCLSVFDDSRLLAALEGTVLYMLERKLNGIDMKLLTKVWAKVSACQARREDFFKNHITILQTRAGGWLSGHAYPPYAARQAQLYAPLFMAVLVQQLPESVLRRAIVHRDLFQEWLCSLARPQEFFRFQDYLTSSLIKARQLPQGLLRDDKPYLPRYIIGFKSSSPATNILESTNATLIKNDQFAIIEGVIRYIGDAHKESSGKPDAAQTRRHLASVLKSLMTILKNEYTIASAAKTISSSIYPEFVRRVISSFKTYANDVCPLDKFFSEPGTIYYHSTTDGPNFFVPTLISHGLHISDRGGEQKLLYYCWESIKAMVRKEESQMIGKLLIQAMDHDLTSDEMSMNMNKAIIKILAPAVIWAGFATAQGFWMADLFLEVAKEQLLIVATIDVGMAAEMALPILRELDMAAMSTVKSCDETASRPHVFLLSKAIRFMTALWHVLTMARMPAKPKMNFHPDALPEASTFRSAPMTKRQAEDLQFLMERFNSFCGRAVMTVHYSSPTERLDPTDSHTSTSPLSKELFGLVIRDEYIKNWEYRDVDGSVWMRNPGNGFLGTMPAETLVIGMAGEKALPSIQDLCCELKEVARTYYELNDSFSFVHAVKGRPEKKKAWKWDIMRATVGLEAIGL